LQLCDLHQRPIVDDAYLVRAFERTGSVEVIAILGNHRYGGQFEEAEIADELSTRSAEVGVTVPRNRKIDVDGFRIIGFDDLWETNRRPHEVATDLTAAGVRLVLCHNPDACDLDC
jgi:hypothetical protein